MKKLDIIFFSQLDDSVPVEHQRKVCALACVKMILDSNICHSREGGNPEISFEQLFEEAVIVGNYEKAGWTHETIVRLLRNHGLLAYRQEFLAHDINFETRLGEVASHTDDFVQFGIDKIKKTIDMGKPVFVSVKEKFSDNREDHMILIIGYENNSFIILDPIVLADKNPRTISIEEFLKFWKKFAIFVE